MPGSADTPRSADTRRLRDTPGDIALGTELVREYVVATAAETGHDVELILPLIPELHDFAGRYLNGGAFLRDEPPLDVVPERTGAIALYRSLGFAETAPAHEYPFAMVFLARDL